MKEITKFWTNPIFIVQTPDISYRPAPGLEGSYTPATWLNLGIEESLASPQSGSTKMTEHGKFTYNYPEFPLPLLLNHTQLQHFTICSPYFSNIILCNLCLPNSPREEWPMATPWAPDAVLLSFRSRPGFSNFIVMYKWMVWGSCEKCRLWFSRSDPGT